MKYRITIPEPCHEDWNNMTPTEKGRFCVVCDKCLTDFTTLSTPQLFAQVSAGKNICGRFREDQLNRFIYQHPPKKSGVFQLALTSALAIFGGIKANAERHHPILTASAERHESQSLKTDGVGKIDTLRIKGVVVDEEGKPVPRVTVYLDEFPLESLTDSLGRFNILIREKVLVDTLTLSVLDLHAYKGYLSVSVKSIREKKSIVFPVAYSDLSDRYMTDLPTASDEDETTAFIFGGIYIEKQSFWQRIGNWFRRVF
jgi:hypothetical protein